MNNDTVTISKKQFDDLLEDHLFLNCLKNAGVDNWDWYDDAIQEFNKIYNEGEDE